MDIIQSDSTVRYPFTPQHRLPPSAYPALFSQGKRFYTPCFIFYYQRSLACTNQLGLAISKKKMRTNVARNRCKRVIREYFRQHQSTLSHYRMVVSVTSRAVSSDTSEWRQCLTQFWQQLNKA